MQNIKTVKDQTLPDISIQLYGTDQAAFQLYRWNMALWDGDGGYLDIPITAGMEVFYDPNWSGADRLAKNKLNNKVIATYGTN